MLFSVQVRLVWVWRLLRLCYQPAVQAMSACWTCTMQRRLPSPYNNNFHRRVYLALGAMSVICQDWRQPLIGLWIAWAVCGTLLELSLELSSNSSFPGLTLVVNNAGIVADEFDSFAKVVDVNVTAVIAGTKLAYERMSASGRSDGVIINVASFGGLVPMPFNPVYAASKAAVVHLCRSCEYMAQGGGGGSKGSGTARVYALCPGFADTAMVKGGLAAGARGLDVAVSMQGGVLSPQWVADHLLELVNNTQLRPGGHLLALPEASYFRRKPVQVPVRVSTQGKTVPLNTDGKL